MIFSENKKPELPEFQSLMSKTDLFLNEDAKKREDYYQSRNGQLLEKDVYEALCICAKHTPFQDTIHLVSGKSFPDIIAAKYYGVEVKSTKENHWTSTGSSILESSRDTSVERIFLTFGKLGKPVAFLSRPYEECLSDIAVTHYPRYRIDMRLKKGETIFDKIGIQYDEFRLMDNPVAPVSAYYKSLLKEGESLWWAEDGTDQAVPPTVRLWTTLDTEEKLRLTIKGYCLFPETFSGTSQTKYNNFALWLVTNEGVVNTNIRDSFSAGGKVLMKTSDLKDVLMPAVFGRIGKYRDLIKFTLQTLPESQLLEHWRVSSIKKTRLQQWCELVVKNSGDSVNQTLSISILEFLFPEFKDNG